MPAYLIATVKKVHERRGLEEYWSSTGPAWEGIEAKRLAIYTPFKHLEGEGPVEGVVVIEFPDMETATRWYESDAYQAARQHRVGAADVEMILVDGGSVPVDQRMPHTKSDARKS
jgi:uncharacterized protein (DUF1330 family)